MRNASVIPEEPLVVEAKRDNQNVAEQKHVQYTPPDEASFGCLPLRFRVVQLRILELQHFLVLCVGSHILRETATRATLVPLLVVF